MGFVRYLIRASAVAALLAAGSISYFTPAMADGCQFVLGFQTLHDMAPSDIGDCLNNQYLGNPNGDQWQNTAKGLMVWRKADNWTAFTNGSMTWLNGQDGLVKRLNTERFPYEGDYGAPGTTAVGGGASAPAPAASAPAAGPVGKTVIPPGAPATIGGNCFNSGYCYKPVYSFATKSAIKVTADLTFTGIASANDFGGLKIGKPLSGSDFKQLTVSSNNAHWSALLFQASGVTALLGGNGLPGARPGSGTVQMTLDQSGLQGTVSVNGGTAVPFTLPSPVSSADSGPDIAVFGTTNVQTAIARLEVSPA